MPKLVCKDCQIGYEIEKSGAWLIEMFSDPPRPYKIWSCDAWKCPGCDVVIMAEFGNEAIAEYYQPDFKDILDSCKKYESAGRVVYEYEDIQYDNEKREATND